MEEEIKVQLQHLKEKSSEMHEQFNSLRDICFLLRHNLHVACEKLIGLGYTAANELDISSGILMLSPQMPSPYLNDSKGLSKIPFSPPRRIFDENGCDVVAEAESIIRTIESKRSGYFSGEKPIADGTLSSPSYFRYPIDSIESPLAQDSSDSFTKEGINATLSYKSKNETSNEDINNLVKATEELNRLKKDLQSNEKTIHSLKNLLRIEREKNSKLECELHTLSSIAAKHVSRLKGSTK